MNPLFNALFGTKQGQIQPPLQQAVNSPSQDWNALLNQIQANPAEFLQRSGYSVPDELMGNPQATVMHLMQTGQINSPMMQRIRPMLNMLGIR